MKFRQLDLKHFGRFSDREIEVADGVNVFYGENESGKSTIFAFLKGMLFGMERGRGRASINDAFSLYEPWENGNYYAGVLRFASGGKQFRLERNFDKYSKSAALICEDDGEEFSLEHGDLDMLLGGLTAAVYENTVAVGQLKAETGQSLAAELRNYAANYYTSGNSDIDLEGALQILRNEKKEVEKQTKSIAFKKQEKRGVIEQEAGYVWRDLHQLKGEYQAIAEELAYRKEQEKQAAEQQPEEIPAEVKRKRRVNPLGILIPLLLIVIAVKFVPAPWASLIAIVIVCADLLYIWNQVKEGKKKEITEPEAELMKMNQEEEISAEKLRWEYNRLTEALREKQTQYDNLQEQLEELDEIGEDYKEQDKRKKAIELAMEELQKLSGEINQEVGQSLNLRASEILNRITGGKYTRITINEKLEMHVIVEGKKIGIERLSRGTIEQIYLALRIAASEVLHEEEYPLVLDDTFAYYDEVRMGNTLRWLAENKKQVLIFTCHSREIGVLENSQVTYHLVDL